jgi:glucokinase
VWSGTNGATGGQDDPMTRNVVLGLDVGGTKVAGGLVDAEGTILLARERSALVEGARDPGLKVTLTLAQEMVAQAEDAGLAVDGIGAGFPEYVDLEGRLTSREVIAWTEQPAEMLARLGPVTVESDVRCAALGEGVRGVAHGLGSYAFVIVGTGLSYALVEDGRVRHGARGEAIALGELEVSRHVEETSAILLERYASGEGIRERYESRTGRRPGGAAEVFSWAASGDQDAISIVRSAGQALGEGLATLVRLLDPGAVVVGGGVSRSSGPWRQELESTYMARLSSRSAPPPILWAELGSAAGIVGAAIAHRQRIAAVGAA